MICDPESVWKEQCLHILILNGNDPWPLTSPPQKATPQSAAWSHSSGRGQGACEHGRPLGSRFSSHTGNRGWAVALAAAAADGGVDEGPGRSGGNG